MKSQFCTHLKVELKQCAKFLYFCPPSLSFFFRHFFLGCSRISKSIWRLHLNLAGRKRKTFADDKDHPKESHTEIGHRSYIENVDLAFIRSFLAHFWAPKVPEEDFYQILKCNRRRRPAHTDWICIPADVCAFQNFKGTFLSLKKNESLPNNSKTVGLENRNDWLMILSRVLITFTLSKPLRRNILCGNCNMIVNESINVLSGIYPERQALDCVDYFPIFRPFPFLFSRTFGRFP